MSEKPSTLELLNNVGLEIAKPGLKAFLVNQGVDERSAEAMSSGFAEAVKWTIAYFLANPNAKVKNQERLEYERFSIYMAHLAKFAKTDKIYMQIDQKFEEHPDLVGFVDRIIRNVEVESSRRKLKYYANLTHSAIVGSAQSWRIDEKTAYSKYILEMSEIDFLILQMPEFHTAGQFGDIDGSVHGLFGGMEVNLPTVIRRLNPDSEILRDNPTEKIPDGIIDAALNRLINFGLLYKTMPIKWSGNINPSDPDTTFKLSSSGRRFHDWCLFEGA